MPAAEACLIVTVHNEWTLYAYGRLLKHHHILDSMHLSLGISDDVAPDVCSVSHRCASGNILIFKNLIAHYMQSKQPQQG